nr:LIM domain-containing protein WLIM2b-like [Ipomoea batatas]
MSFIGTQQKCKACEKTVYPVELLSADGINYHKSCFRCTHCKGTLKLSNYSSMEGVLYCKPHFEQLFKESGNFNKNFQSPAKSAEKLTPELTRSPSKAASMFSGTQEKCATCGKTAYPLEKMSSQVTVENQSYHKSCFKCSHGGCSLTPSNYAALDGILYCKPHFSQLFKEKAKGPEKAKKTYPAGDDNSGDNRDKSYISEPSLSLQSHQIGKDGSEERRGGANRLVERDGQELNPRSYRLHRNHLHPRNGDVAEQRASRHVAHGEKDRLCTNKLLRIEVEGATKTHHGFGWEVGLELSSDDATVAVRPADLSPDAAVVRAALLGLSLVDVGHTLSQEMGLWTLLEGCLLLANALAILNEDRFLAPRGWSFQEYSGIKRNSFKGQILGLIYATQYLRVPLLLLNILCIVVKLVSG